jgi:hypothetical protein
MTGHPLFDLILTLTLAFTCIVLLAWAFSDTDRGPA